MIELTTTDGSLLSVNPATVFCFQQKDSGTTRIVSTTGNVTIVREDYSTVKKRFAAWFKV